LNGGEVSVGGQHKPFSSSLLLVTVKFEPATRFLVVGVEIVILLAVNDDIVVPLANWNP
jgi:hypothetical protein